MSWGMEVMVRFMKLKWGEKERKGDWIGCEKLERKDWVGMGDWVNWVGKN